MSSWCFGVSVLDLFFSWVVGCSLLGWLHFLCNGWLTRLQIGFKLPILTDVLPDSAILIRVPESGFSRRRHISRDICSSLASCKLTRPNVSDGKLRTSLNIFGLSQVQKVFRVGTIYSFISRVCNLSRCPGPTVTRYIRQVLSDLLAVFISR